MWPLPYVDEIDRASYPIVTSNMFDPTEEETAISPFPCFATSTLVMRSGTDVPAAKKVNPITCDRGSEFLIINKSWS